jgi:hypothetical protein
MAFSIIKPDTEDQSFPEDNITVFLGGSIDNGKATLWSHEVQQGLKHFEDVTILNPRREVWLPEIEQRARNDVFRYQVNWELDHIDNADIVFFYFEAGSVSPITLQELGYVVGKGQEPVVCCPDRFWRKGNVEIMCSRNAIPLYSEINEAIIALTERIAVVREDRKLRVI